MRRPTRIVHADGRVGKLRFVPKTKVGDAEAYGWADTTTGDVCIATRNQGRTQQGLTMIHEIIHLSDPELPETAVRRLTSGMATLMRHNRGLFLWVLASWPEDNHADQSD